VWEDLTYNRIGIVEELATLFDREVLLFQNVHQKRCVA
jgi:hypothetical protein